MTNPTSRVRVRPIVISLSSNNLSYARGGVALRLWDAYPVPSTAPIDSASWGIVPAWGFAVVTESATPGLVPGALLWGFWPTADVPVDLKLEPGPLDGHWTEVSEPRKVLMTIYNNYEVEPLITSAVKTPSDLANLAWQALFRPVWQTGYLLSEYVLSTKTATSQLHSPLAPIHPLGSNLSWSQEDADLSGGLLISLSASGKTARIFAYQVFKRLEESRPVKFVQITQAPDLIDSVGSKMGSKLPCETISYGDLQQALSDGETLPSWLPEKTPKKVAILDFGGRDSSLECLLKIVSKYYLIGGPKIMILHVGSQQKIYESGELQKAGEEFARLGKIQVNTSRIRDAALHAIGPEAYFQTLSPVWNGWLDASHSIMPDIQMVWGDGVSGKMGIEQGWERLSRGEVGAQEGLVYRLGTAGEK